VIVIDVEPASLWLRSTDSAAAMLHFEHSRILLGGNTVSFAEILITLLLGFQLPDLARGDTVSRLL
jgi:hypothetical protein